MIEFLIIVFLIYMWIYGMMRSFTGKKQDSWLSIHDIQQSMKKPKQSTSSRQCRQYQRQQQEINETIDYLNDTVDNMNQQREALNQHQEELLAEQQQFREQQQAFYSERNQYIHERDKQQQYSDNGKTAYEILGLEADASQAQIKKRYKELASQYHPDKASNTNEAIQKLAEEEFKKIQQAYDELKDK